MSSILVVSLIFAGFGALVGKFWKGRLWLGAVLGLLGPLGLAVLCFIPRRVDMDLSKLQGTSWWYVSREGVQVGPVDAGQFADAIRLRQLVPSALVWNETMGDWTMARNLPTLTPLFRARHRRSYQMSALGAVFFWGGLVLGFISLGAYRDNLWLAVKGEKITAEVVSVKPNGKLQQVIFRVPGEAGTHEDWVSGTKDVRVGATVAAWRLKNRPQVCRLSNSPISVHLVIMLFAGASVYRGCRRETLETG